MSAAISRTDLIRGPAIVTWNSVTMYSRNDIVVKLAPVFRPVLASMYDEIDKVKTDLMVKCNVTLWGAWESLSTIFPSALMNPVIGASLFGAHRICRWC
jgi:hypothetical protein